MAVGGIDVVASGDWGFSWRPAGEGYMRRAAHALATADGLWLVDPIDGEGLDAALAARGVLAGCVLTIDRHARDAQSIAARHGVAVHADEALGSMRRRGPLVRFTGRLGGSGLESIPLPGRGFSRWWRECALRWHDRRVLVVGESIGRAPYFLIGDEVLGLHPLRRTTPPRELAGLGPEILLVGHGDPVTHDAAPLLDDLIVAGRGRRTFGWRARSALAAWRAR